ncbi:MAG: OsmC family protein [candidate division Zixibacteria bacterium]|nr:OsmC family protein [candidate division Zixibacteria bacterium]
MLTAKMKWAGGLKFEGTSAYGHLIATDGGKGHGGDEEGYQPTELLLFGIAGCTGIDVVRILEKQRQQLKSLEIEITAHQNDKYPKPFHTIEVKFIATGTDLNPKKLGLAIAMSESKYCAVSQTVENAGKVVSSYEIREE